MNTAMVAPIRPASVKSCQGSNECCGSVEVSELIVEAGVDGWIDGHVRAGGTGCSRARRPTARGYDQRQQPHEGKRIRQHPGERIEPTARDGENGRAILLDERRKDVVFALSFLDVLLQARDLGVVSVAGGPHRAVVERAANAAGRTTH